MGTASTLELPYPRLVEGRFASLDVFTDEELFLSCGVRIAFTTRTGGVSMFPFDSFNLGDRVDDDPVCVEANRYMLRNAFGARDASFINPLQVHGDTVVSVIDGGSIDEAVSRAREGADSLVVCRDDVAALLCFADCMPLIIVAPTGAFSIAHAGWRGVVNGIVSKSIAELQQQTGCDPSSFNVYIGPYIHSCHFEVGDETRDAFSRLFGASVCIPYPQSPSHRDHVDMGAAMRMTLSRSGIDPVRVADVDLCTVCNQELFFSYRGSDGRCGRHGAFAVRLSPADGEASGCPDLPSSNGRATRRISGAAAAFKDLKNPFRRFERKK